MSAQLKIRDLELLVALHEEGTFTQAAKRFGISEPALSKRLRLVERFVNVPLFERSYNGARPTDSGRSFVAFAVESIYAFKRAVQEAQEAKYEERPRLRIGVSAYLPPKLISTLNSIALPLYRDLTIEIVMGRSMELLADLQQHRVDLALVSSPPETPTITTVRVATSPFMIVFREGHALAKKNVVQLAEVAEYPWAFFKRSVHPYLHDLILQRVEGEQRKATIIHRGSHPDQAGALLTDDSTLAWLNPAGTEYVANRGFIHLPLLDHHIRIETHLAALANNKSQMVSEFARKFVKRMEEQRAPEQLELPIT